MNYHPFQPQTVLQAKENNSYTYLCAKCERPATDKIHANGTTKEREDIIRTLIDALTTVSQTIDVSTINNSKRATAKWSKVIEQIDAALALAHEGGF